MVVRSVVPSSVKRTSVPAPPRAEYDGVAVLPTFASRVSTVKFEMLHLRFYAVILDTVVVNKNNKSSRCYFGGADGSESLIHSSNNRRFSST